MAIKFLPLSAIERIFALTNEELVVLSGGEPFEYDHLPGLFELLKEVKAPFRIATGGHIPLANHGADLKNMPRFVGISLGTDVLSPRSPKYMEHKKIWAANVAFLNNHQIPYSLTFTVQGDLNLSKLVSETSALGSAPEFIYLRISSNKNKQLVQESLQQSFPETFIITDELQD
ncbi:hypothetical protein ACES2L_12260 [Bdellovibrio bacteriovorus]